MIDYATAWLLAMQVLDVLTTMHILKHGGRELNPVLAYLFAKFGSTKVLVSYKAVIFGLVGWLYFAGQETIIAALALLYTAVVINNSMQVKS